MPDYVEHPMFLHGLDVGESIGKSHAVRQAQAAYDAGEIELWLDYHRAKTLEEWDEWQQKYGPTMHDQFEERWKTK